MGVTAADGSGGATGDGPLWGMRILGILVVLRQMMPEAPDFVGVCRSLKTALSR
jgi:hypothetical protein